MRWSAVVLLASGCRINFDPLATADASDSADAAKAADAALVVPGLVALYTMEGLAAPATMIPDVVGSHHAMCVTGTCPASTTGHRGSGAQFDGTMRLQVSSMPDLETPAGYTVAAWVQCTNIASLTLATIVNKKATVATQDTWGLEVDSKRVTFYSNHPGDPADFLKGASDLDSQWHHLAVRWDGSQKSVWLDGVNDGVSAGRANDFTGGVIDIGADQFGGTQNAPFTGIADDIAIYGRALTDAEMLSIAR